MAVTYASDEAQSPQMGAGGAPKMAPPSGRNFEEAITKSAAKAVKGVGHVTRGVPLDDASDGAAIFTKSHDLMLRTKAATVQGRHDSDTVIGSLATEFATNPQFAPLAYRLRADADVRKNFTAQNLGATGAPYGLVPFDLGAPSPPGLPRLYPQLRGPCGAIRR